MIAFLLLPLLIAVFLAANCVTKAAANDRARWKVVSAPVIDGKATDVQKRDALAMITSGRLDHFGKDEASITAVLKCCLKDVDGSIRDAAVKATMAVTGKGTDFSLGFPFLRGIHYAVAQAVMQSSDVLSLHLFIRDALGHAGDSLSMALGLKVVLWCQSMIPVETDECLTDMAALLGKAIEARGYNRSTALLFVGFALDLCRGAHAKLVIFAALVPTIVKMSHDPVTQTGEQWTALECLHSLAKAHPHAVTPHRAAIIDLCDKIDKEAVASETRATLSSELRACLATSDASKCDRCEQMKQPLPACSCRSEDGLSCDQAEKEGRADEEKD